jgi:uncharacterized protein YajQ (UPF0234 family)
MPSFDVVSEIDLHEVTNAVDQSNREVSTRFDFKGINAKYELKENVVTIFGEADFHIKQMAEILILKLTKRGIDIQCLEYKDIQISGREAKQEITLRQGIETELGKKISKMIKDKKMKVQPSIQGDKVRVTGKNRDDLQECIAMLREAKLEMPLQFNNFRD